MIKKIVSSHISSITGAALLLGAASLISRGVGLFRDRLFAHLFGASSVLDAYYAAFRIPDLVYNLLIVGALSAGFIPVFLKLREQDTAASWKLTNTILQLAGLLLIAAAAILFLAAPVLVPLLVPGFTNTTLDLTITMTRIMLVSPLLLGISAVVSGVLQSLKSFAVYALTPIVYNLGIIIGAAVLVPMVGTIGLAYGVILGALFHLLIQLPTLVHLGFRFHWHLRITDEVKEIGRLMLPRTLAQATQQLNLIVITGIASTMTAGSLAIFHFANNLQFVPVGIIGISFAIAAFPTLSEFVAKGKQDEMIDHLTRTIRQILFFIIPFSLLLLILRASIVRVILGSGEFDWAATITTANAVAFFALSLFAQCLIPLLARAFFALKDTWTPLVISFIGTLITIIFSLAFKEGYGVVGLAMAFSIGAIIQAALLWLTLRAKIGTLHESEMVETLLKISVASLLLAVVTQLMKVPIAAVVDMTRFWGIFIQGFIAGSCGIAVFVGAATVLRIDEWLDLRRSLERRWLKLTNVEVHVGEGDEL